MLWAMDKLESMHWLHRRNLKEGAAKITVSFIRIDPVSILSSVAQNFWRRVFINPDLLLSNMGFEKCRVQIRKFVESFQ